MDKEIENISREMARNLKRKQSMEKKIMILIPPKLRFPLAWTLFFIIIGITIQSLKSGSIIFASFFTSSYIQWIKSLGFFTNLVSYENQTEVLKALAKEWYYFFFSGGILSLIWALISYITHSEIIIRK